MFTRSGLGIASFALLLVLCGCSKQMEQGPSAVSRPAISAADCRVEIKVEPAGPWDLPVQQGTALPATVSVANKGKTSWGGAGPEMLLGAVWFRSDKHDTAHSPNLGEQWWHLPAPIRPGDRLRFHVTIGLPSSPGDYSIWFSMLQPGVMWCYHVGDPPLKVSVRMLPER
jgi:hypothetical protein